MAKYKGRFDWISFQVIGDDLATELDRMKLS